MPFWSCWGFISSSGIKLPVTVLAVAFLISTGMAVVWGDDARGDLSWGESLTLGNYSIQAADFFAPENSPARVVLTVRSQDQPEEIRILQAGEGFEIDDRLKVVVGQVRIEDLVENQSSADVRMWVPAVPEITLLIMPDKDYYFGGDEINLELVAKNTGLAAAEGLKVTIECQDIPSIDALRKGVLSPGETWKEDGKNPSMKLRAPYLAEPGPVTISALASFEDSEGAFHQSLARTSFKVAGPLQLHKRFEEKQRFGKNYFVIDTLRNTGNRTLRVTLQDFAGSDFKTGSPLCWDLTLPSGGTEVVSYALEARQPGTGLVLPAARAGYSLDGRDYQVESESPVVDVFGPLLKVSRRVSPPRLILGEEAEVVMELENAGNRYAAVTVDSDLPEEVLSVKGSLNGSFSLGPGEIKSLSCRLKCLQTGRLKLLPQKVSYRDVQGNEYQTDCPASTIVVEEEPLPSVEDLQDSESENIPLEEEAPVEGGSPLQAAIPLAIVLALFLVFSRYL